MLQPIPPTEAIRIAVLHALEVLDTDPDARYDCIVNLAAQIAGVPMANISLVDTDRQWFMAKVGVPVSETPRNVSFCQHTIMTPSPMVINDALQDERFADSPLVTGPDGIRFYAGVPITVMGENMGALCVLDHKPNELTDHTMKSLEILASLVSDLIQNDFLKHKVIEDEQKPAQVATPAPTIEA